MNKRIGISAIIFDMDGVIVDSEPLHLKAKQMVFEMQDIEFDESHNKQYLGRKDLGMFNDMIHRYNLKIAPEKLVMAKDAILCQLLIDKSLPRPGVLETLLDARRTGLPLAIASSGNSAAVHLVLEIFGIKHFFSRIVTGDDVKNGKPDPEVYLKTAELIGIDPQFCLAIEDTAHGITAANRAGMISCSVPCPSTAHEDHKHADLRLDSLQKLDIQKLIRMPVRKTDQNPLSPIRPRKRITASKTAFPLPALDSSGLIFGST